LSERLFLTDGGLETTLIFVQGWDVPYMAAFHLFGNPQAVEAIRDCLAEYAKVATQHGTGLILETNTWRANPEWAEKLGYDAAQLADVHRQAVQLNESIRDQYQTAATPIVISGNLGPRGDGYVANLRMTAAQAADYHRPQTETFATTNADMVCAMTLNYVEEAIGIVTAAKQTGMPVAISFTVETDGKLPTGQALSEAIEQVDKATDEYASYFMVNCAHPTHFKHVLAGGSWLKRLRGVRANASRKSHAELDESTELDIGDPDELSSLYAQLKERVPHLNVMGGCCGTDHRHVEKIAAACKPLFG
jgi:S-methylmethionine-dependent homocysteine/selenocysteine methylase